MQPKKKKQLLQNIIYIKTLEDIHIISDNRSRFFSVTILSMKRIKKKLTKLFELALDKNSVKDGKI